MVQDVMNVLLLVLDLIQKIVVNANQIITQQNLEVMLLAHHAQNLKIVQVALVLNVLSAMKDLKQCLTNHAKAFLLIVEIIKQNQ